MGDPTSGVVEGGPAVRDLYPEYVEDGNVYEMIAKAHLDKGDKAAAMRGAGTLHARRRTQSVDT